MSQLKQIDRYIIRRLLGGGGMSTVYVAYDPNRDDQVAVKVLRTGLSDDPEMRERFEREARMLAQLHHPAIMPLLDYGEADDRLYFVMPYMRNGSLQERLLAGALPFDEALLILRRIALALDVAHGRSIIHRDIKPHNIIFDDSHMACLADFGIARLVDLNKPQQTVTLVGTPEYMAPEQVVESNISPQTDVYQLGIVMFQMLTGRRPFEGSVHSIMTQHLNDAPPLVEALMPDLPEGCDQVLAKALAKNPEERYTTIGAFAAAVVALQGKQPRQISQEHTIVVPPLFMAGSSAENTPPPPTRQTNIIKVNPQTALPAVNLRKLLWSSMALVTLFAVLAVFSLGNNPRNRNWRGEDTSAETVLVNQAPALLEVNDTALIELPENAQEPQAAVVEQTTAHAADTQNGPTIVIHDEIYSGADVAQTVHFPEAEVLFDRSEQTVEPTNTPETINVTVEASQVIVVEPPSDDLTSNEPNQTDQVSAETVVDTDETVVTTNEVTSVPVVAETAEVATEVAAVDPSPTAASEQERAPEVETSPVVVEGETAPAPVVVEEAAPAVEAVEVEPVTEAVVNTVAVETILEQTTGGGVGNSAEIVTETIQEPRPQSPPPNTNNPPPPNPNNNGGGRGNENRQANNGRNNNNGNGNGNDRNNRGNRNNNNGQDN